jgi:hypothetical protein
VEKTPTSTSPPTIEEQKDVVTKDHYTDGYELGKLHGVSRCKRLYYQGDENKMDNTVPTEYISGYNDGYRNGRIDYKK